MISAMIDLTVAATVGLIWGFYAWAVSRIVLVDESHWILLVAISAAMNTRSFDRIANPIVFRITGWKAFNPESTRNRNPK